MSYILDTSTVIAIIKNRKIERKLEEALFNRKEVSTNGISYYEVKRGLLAESATKQLYIFNKLCEKIKILLLDNKTIFDKAAEIYADLRRRGELISDADILIAAMAITQNLVLVSNDIDFLRIKDLTLENWLQKS